MRTRTIPARFVKANTDMLRGLDLFVQGLERRNRGLAAHSEPEYSAGLDMIAQSLAEQKTAIGEYPKDARITL